MPSAFDIVLPCYNPGARWTESLLSFYESVSGKYPLQFIVVNDGSTQKDVKIQVEKLKTQQVPVRFISYQHNKGKGYALREGVKECTAEYTLYTDVDFPFTNQSMLRVMEALVNNQQDIVAGFRSEEYYRNKMSGFRILLSRAFRNFIRRFLKINITDTQCGLKGFNKTGREKFLSTRINRYLFDFEFIYTACRDKGIRILPVEVQLKENIVFSKMRIDVLLQESLNLFYVLWFRRR